MSIGTAQRVVGATAAAGGATALVFGVANAQAHYDRRGQVAEIRAAADTAEAAQLAPTGELQEASDSLRRSIDEWGSSGMRLAVSGGIAALSGITALATHGTASTVAASIAAGSALFAGVSGIDAGLDFRAAQRHAADTTEAFGEWTARADEAQATDRLASAIAEPALAAATEVPSAPERDGLVQPRPVGLDDDIAAELHGSETWEPTVAELAQDLRTADAELSTDTQRTTLRTALAAWTDVDLPTTGSADWDGVAARMDRSGDGVVDFGERTTRNDAYALAAYAGMRELVVADGEDPAVAMPLVLEMMARGMDLPTGPERARMALTERNLEEIASGTTGARLASMDAVVEALDARIDALPDPNPRGTAG